PHLLRCSIDPELQAELVVTRRWREGRHMGLHVLVEQPVRRSFTLLSSLAGDHQAGNAMMALAAALCLGIELPAVRTIHLPPLAALLITVGPMAARVVMGALAGDHPPAHSTNVPDNATAAQLLATTLRPGDAIFVKGSRGARLEEIIAALASS